MRIFGWFLAVTMMGALYAQAQVPITSEASGDTRVLVAVPDFAAAPGAEAVAKEMAAVLRYDLEFTNLFRLLDPTEYPRSFTAFTSDPSQIDFPSWRPAHISYLVYAYVTFQGNTLVAECRMFDVNTGTQAAGQRLTATKDLPRLVAHRFSEEVVKIVDGVPGIASSQVIYSAKTAGGNKELFIADYDGQNARQLTHFNSITIQPKYSPDGKKVAFVSYKDRYPFLYIYDLASGTTMPFSRNVGLNANPSWAPDGHAIALCLSKDGNNEIYVKTFGGGERRLTNNPASDSEPAYDSSGSRIAFVSDRNGPPELFVMTASGGTPQRLSRGGKAYDPVWSPDGKMIAYIGDHGGGLQTYVMNADGSNERPLSDGGPCESPTWSPDSRNVMYSAGGTIYAANVQPQAVHRMAFPGRGCEGPTWGPRR